MTLLVVGLNHRTAPVDVLERVVAANADGKLSAALRDAEHVLESVALVSCNRVELYADVTRFHVGVADLSNALERHSGLAAHELTPSLYVHYQERAIHHLFSVACGLDSMVVGEPQILGQVRQAMRAAEEDGTLGRELGELFRRSLRAGKRARTETRIDAAGASLVSVALDAVRDVVGDLTGKRALVVGAGSMGGLSAATLRRQGAELAVANRSRPAAERLVAEADGRALDLDQVAAELSSTDLVITCTGAVGTVLTKADVEAALPARQGRELVLVDLAVPRDIDPAVAELPGVTLVGFEQLAEREVETDDLEAVQLVVAEEVEAFRQSVEQAQVAPTVAALRGAAARVVEHEMERLRGRVPDLDERAEAEVARTVHRIVDKLLHTPTVRVKQLASGPEGGSYAAALRELFDLDPAKAEAVARVDVDGDMGEVSGER